MIIPRILEIDVVFDIYQIILLNQLVNHFFAQELYFLCTIKKFNLSVHAINTCLTLSIVIQWGRAYSLHNLPLKVMLVRAGTCGTTATRCSGTDQRRRQQTQVFSQVDNIISNLIWIRWYRKQILPSVFILGCIMSLLVYYGYTSGLNGPQNTHNRLGWT